MAAHGTVSVWFGSASHVTVPALSTLMNLYCTTVLGARLTVPAHRGLFDVYPDAPRATAEAVFQLPRAATFPDLWSSLIIQPVSFVF